MLQPSHDELRRMRWFRLAALWCAAFALAAGAAGVALSATEPRLITGGFAAMRASIALSVVACAVALALGLRHAGGASEWWSRGIALAVGVVACVTLLEYAVGTTLHMDSLLAADGVAADPGRMAPQTAMALLLFAISVGMLKYGDGRLGAVADSVLVTHAMLLYAVISGYFFHSDELIGAAGATRMSPLVVIVMSVLWTGLLCARTDRGVCRVIVGDGRGSQVIRYLLMPTMLFPLLIGLARTWAESAGLASPLGASVFATIQSGLRIAVIVSVGYLLNRSERERRAEQLRREEAERMVAMCAWTRRIRWHGEWVPVDRFLRDRFGLEVTHGISEEALDEELALLGLTAEHPRRPAA